MTEADLNRQADQYSQTNDGYDARMISWLIDALLLHREVEFPNEDDSPANPLAQWAIAGRASLGQHPNDT